MWSKPKPLVQVPWPTGRYFFCVPHYKQSHSTLACFRYTLQRANETSQASRKKVQHKRAINLLVFLYTFARFFFHGVLLPHPERPGIESGRGRCPTKKTSDSSSPYSIFVRPSPLLILIIIRAWSLSSFFLLSSLPKLSLIYSSSSPRRCRFFGPGGQTQFPHLLTPSPLNDSLSIQLNSLERDGAREEKKRWQLVQLLLVCIFELEF